MVEKGAVFNGKLSMGKPSGADVSAAAKAAANAGKGGQQGGHGDPNNPHDKKNR